MFNYIEPRLIKIFDNVHRIIQNAPIACIHCCAYVFEYKYVFFKQLILSFTNYNEAKTNRFIDRVFFVTTWRTKAGKLRLYFLTRSANCDFVM